MRENAWVISVNMGYGHQRTAHPLRRLAPDGKIINANDYQNIPEKDKKIWETTRRGYELISNFYQAPLVGRTIFSFFDRFQRILTFYPKRDLSKPNFVLKQVYSRLKKGWGEHLIKDLKFKNPKLPIVSTFFTPAFMAEFFNYPGEIFCIVCDADISRTWAPLKPKESKIKYFTPNERTTERLKLYGVKPENIFLTGYPLPSENITSNPPAGGMEILKEDLKRRLLNLDTKRKYFEKYKDLIESRLEELPKKSTHPLTIMFSIGGAGAQKEIAIKIIKRLKPYLGQGQLRIILSAGIRKKVKEYFERELKKLNLTQSNFIKIIYEKDIADYFQGFNRHLREVDILWTKPSELSFYSALGVPIIIAPPIGSQEEFNMRWLLKSGFGISQEDPSHISEWLFDWLDHGYLAEMAVEGFIEGEKMGTYNIKKIIEK